MRVGGADLSHSSPHARAVSERRTPEPGVVAGAQTRSAPHGRTAASVDVTGRGSSPTWSSRPHVAACVDDALYRRLAWWPRRRGWPLRTEVATWSRSCCPTCRRAGTRAVCRVPARARPRARRRPARTHGHRLGHRRHGDDPDRATTSARCVERARALPASPRLSERPAAPDRLVSSADGLVPFRARAQEGRAASSRARRPRHRRAPPR